MNHHYPYELTIYVDDPELFDKYTVAAEKHLENIKSEYFDSGFDMYVPETIISKPGQGINISKNTWHGVLCPLYSPGLFAAIDRIGEGPNLEEHWFKKAWTII